MTREIKTLDPRKPAPVLYLVKWSPLVADSLTERDRDFLWNHFVSSFGLREMYFLDEDDIEAFESTLGPEELRKYRLVLKRLRRAITQEGGHVHITFSYKVEGQKGRKN